MAHDIVLGETNRDWSCGHLVVTERGPWDKLPDAPTLAAETRAVFSKAAAAAIKMRRAGRLADADWKDFGKLHRRWLTWSDQHRGRFEERDVLPLWNFRETGKKFAKKLAALAALSSPGALVPAKPTEPSLTTNARPWYVALGAALALAGVGLFSTKTKKKR